jgi:NADH:ubiquinone oxidoreductase subunit D
LLNIGLISKISALNLGFTGLLLRSTGVSWDLRKNNSYERYSKIKFNVPISTSGDCYDRYILRIEEMRQSLIILEHCLEYIPKGLIKIENSKFNSPSRRDLKNSMESLIHHFKLYSEGFITPKGESYLGIEAPKGELGIYLVSNTTNYPYRCKIRAPGFIHLQSIDYIAKNLLIADVVTIIGTLDIVLGEIDR